MVNQDKRRRDIEQAIEDKRTAIIAEKRAIDADEVEYRQQRLTLSAFEERRENHQKQITRLQAEIDTLERELQAIKDGDDSEVEPRTLPQALQALLDAVRDPEGGIVLSVEQATAIKNHKPADLTEYRLGRIAEWSLPRYQFDKRFVKMTLWLDKGRDSSDSQRETPVNKTYTDLRDILNERDDTALILLGEPGGGKSTLMRRLQLEDAIDRLRDGGGRLSFFISLNDYRPEREHDPLPSPREWLNAMWSREYPALPSLDSLLCEGRVLLLLDALNEMPHVDDTEYRKRVDLWQTFLASMRADHRANRAIITCRTRDYAAPLGTKNLPVPRIDIQRMNDKQVQDFLTVYLPNLSESVWSKLRGTRQLDLFRTPFYLKLLIDQVEGRGDIPVGRAALFTGFIRQTLKRELEGKNTLLATDDLIDSDDRQQITLEDWTKAYELPYGGCLMPGLTDLAYRAQESGRLSDGAQVKLREADALKLIDHPLAKQIIRAGIDLTVLDKIGRDVQFFHQLLQEFFAARRLAEHPNPALVKRPWKADEVSPSLTETLSTLPDGDPLPPLHSTGWEQTVLLAAVMSETPDDFIRGLIDADLPLAARCAASPEITLDPALKRELQAALIHRTQDFQNADLRARMAAGFALGELGDPRFARKTGPHGDYLLPPLSKPIPAGTYPIGDDNSNYNEERPAHTVTLPAFQIGAFPVTNAEYALFMAAGGYEDERWWETTAAKAWLRGEGSNERQKTSWRDTRKLLANWSVEFLKGLVKENRITSKQAEDWITIKSWSIEYFESWLDEQFPTGKIYHQPECWDVSRFNNPSQSVVGVTWFEAQAYCAWLSAQTGQTYTLPSEIEFEAAARGTAGREYPYGSPFDSVRGNTFESHIRRTTPVGIFDNATPEGAFDLTGNAYTWTRSLYDKERFKYPYHPDDGREDADDVETRRVVRGGSWFNNQDFARAAYRSWDAPYDRLITFGFRVVCVVPSLGS